MPDMPPPPPALEIVFRYLMLLYNSPQGLKMLIPRQDHRAVLRDTATDLVIPLSQALVHVEIDGVPDQPAPTKLYTNDLLLSLERALQLDDPIAPLDEFLNPENVSKKLNALAILPGGTITAFPSVAFPEKANEIVRFEFGVANVVCSKITDTTLYRKAFPTSAREVALVVTTPRRKVRIDITQGARFELRNDDETFGALPDPNTYHSRELEEILNFVGEQGNVLCDTFACAKFYCGDPQDKAVPCP